MIYGLKYVPTHPRGDDDIVLRSLSVPQEFSPADQQVMREAIRSMGDACKVVVEIGVHRAEELPKENGSTYVLMASKPENAWYLGVDIEGRKYVRGWASNVHTVCCNSSNVEKVMEEVRKVGPGMIDFLHIDGHHSVNQAVKDWQYVEFLSDHGIVAIHDTSYHVGPIELVKAIDREMFDVTSYHHNREDDWGITIVRRRVPRKDGDEARQETLGGGDLD